MISRRRFLRMPIAALAAMLPATALAQYPMPYGQMPVEPDEPSITIDSMNKRLLFLESDNLWRDITVKWLEFNVNALLRCFHGCGTMNLPPKYRL